MASCSLPLALLCLVAVLALSAQAIKLPNNFANSRYTYCLSSGGYYKSIILAVRPTSRNDTFVFEENSRGMYNSCNDTFFFGAEKSVYKVLFVQDLGTNQSLIQYFDTTKDTAYAFDNFASAGLTATCAAQANCCTVPKLNGQPVNLLPCDAKQCSGTGISYDFFQLNSDGSFSWGAAAAQCDSTKVVNTPDVPFVRTGALHSYDSSSDASTLVPATVAVLVVLASLVAALF